MAAILSQPQCVSDAPCHSFRGKFHINTQDNKLQIIFEIYTFEITVASPKGQWVNENICFFVRCVIFLSTVNQMFPSSPLRCYTFAILYEDHNKWLPWQHLWSEYVHGLVQDCSNSIANALGLALLTLSWDKNWDSHSLVNGYPSFYPRIGLVAPSPGVTVVLH